MEIRLGAFVAGSPPDRTGAQSTAACTLVVVYGAQHRDVLLEGAQRFSHNVARDLERCRRRRCCCFMPCSRSRARRSACCSEGGQPAYCASCRSLWLALDLPAPPSPKRSAAARSRNTVTPAMASLQPLPLGPKSRFRVHRQAEHPRRQLKRLCQGVDRVSWMPEASRSWKLPTRGESRAKARRCAASCMAPPIAGACSVRAPAGSAAQSRGGSRAHAPPAPQLPGRLRRRRRWRPAPGSTAASWDDALRIHRLHLHHRLGDPEPQ